MKRLTTLILVLVASEFILRLGVEGLVSVPHGVLFLVVIAIGLGFGFVRLIEAGLAVASVLIFAGMYGGENSIELLRLLLVCSLVLLGISVMVSGFRGR